MKMPPALVKDTEDIHVVIETPKGSRNKFVYDEETGFFRLTKVFPAGLVFPFEFGFIPGTIAEDGDPTDVLVLMDEPSFPGCLVEARVIGVIEAEQKEKNDEVIRNDRIVAVARESQTYSLIRSIDDLDQDIIEDVILFFRRYHKRSKTEFYPIRNSGASEAIALIKKTIRNGGD